MFPLKYFDKLMDRVNQNTEKGWGWKIVVRVADVALEASTFPKNGYRKATHRPTPPPPKPHAGSVDVSGLDFKETNAYFAWAFAYPQGSDEPLPEAESILAAIAASEKGEYVLDGFLYKMGGDDKKLLNRVKQRAKK